VSLIEIHGSNPFLINGAVQADPYISLSSSVDSQDYVINNSYKLDGVLTGCSYGELAVARDALVRSFDWKEDESITGAILISGVTNGSVVLGKYVSDVALFPRSIDFNSSNYLGSLQYVITIDEVNGYDDGQGEDGIINKVHTETTSTTEDGCVTISTNLSCSPDANMQACWGLQSGSNWISGRLKANTLGYASRSSALPLQMESLTIDPITLSVSYSKTEGAECKASNLSKAGAPNATYDFTHCTEKSTPNASCAAADQVVTVQHKGEVYHSGASYETLLNDLDTELLSSFNKSIESYNINYNQSTDTLQYNFSTVEDGDGNITYMPRDLIYNDKTINHSTDHDNGVDGTTVNGTVKVINPVDKGPAVINAYPESTVKVEAKAEAGQDQNEISNSFTRDEVAGTINYSYGFSSDADPNATVGIDGFSGISSYSISVTPPRQEYDTVANLNCDDLIFEGAGVSQASVAISIKAISGSGYNFEDESKECQDFLLNTFVPSRGSEIVTTDAITKDNFDTQLTREYRSTYEGNSVIDENDILTMR
jgi:hypothetical protein